MNNTNKIKTIIGRASKKYIILPADNVLKYSKKQLRDLESNFLLYAEALSNIDLIVREQKEIWATCPYCKLKFTKVVKNTEMRKSFWCQTCDR